MRKFDVIPGNPPYQKGNGNKGAGNILWDKFVTKADELVKDGGYVCLVHPSVWRKAGHVLQPVILNGMQYLEIHNEKDGQKTFGANTRYDWYVRQKGKVATETLVKDQTGTESTVDLSAWGFVPNSDFALVGRLLAGPNDERVSILHSESAYSARSLPSHEGRKQWMAKTKDCSRKNSREDSQFSQGFLAQTHD